MRVRALVDCHECNGSGKCPGGCMNCVSLIDHSCNGCYGSGEYITEVTLLPQPPQPSPAIEIDLSVQGRGSIKPRADEYVLMALLSRVVALQKLAEWGEPDCRVVIIPFPSSLSVDAQVSIKNMLSLPGVSLRQDDAYQSLEIIVERDEQP